MYSLEKGPPRFHQVEPYMGHFVMFKKPPASPVAAGAATALITYVGPDEVNSCSRFFYEIHQLQ